MTSPGFFCSCPPLLELEEVLPPAPALAAPAACDVLKSSSAILCNAISDVNHSILFPPATDDGKPATALIRLLAVVHVHVLGVDDIARLLLLLPAAARARRGAAASACACRTGSLRRFEKLLGDLVQRDLGRKSFDSLPTCN